MFCLLWGLLVLEVVSGRTLILLYGLFKGNSGQKAASVDGHRLVGHGFKSTQPWSFVSIYKSHQWNGVIVIISNIHV